ncbi:1-deoxy-D-xylulose-5-phosphate synthase [Candidatus Fermentibacteria bacterium]|nr:MAG: 1-deoxy-D-xylulose-5-phosphate synthase [Candidatus Fermentibacteria bacterium]
MTRLLDSIKDPSVIQKLTLEERVNLAEEIRTRIIEVICHTGGHLASSLGVVELTIALLSVYNPSFDRIVWDVGHQTYPWKLLTGRRELFHTIRQSGGISGFPKRSESPCDCFGTGHSSTSISAALGFASARDIRGGSERVVAVIGDGAMTAGMAFEGLNNLSIDGTDITIILNDNEMSISRNVGAFSKHLNKLLTDDTYNKFKDGIWNALGKVPSLGERMRIAAHEVSSAIKHTISTRASVFEEFGLTYVGPVPGHDLPTLTGVLSRVRKLRGPVLVHVVTRKGKGFEPAECQPVSHHGVSGASVKAPGRSFTSAFSSAVTEAALRDNSVVAVTAAMPGGTGLTGFAEQFPERFFDVGIAEQHAVTFACGMAFGGLKPVVAVYSSFMQRAYDQVIHDAALQKAPVIFAMDRAGVVGADGPTHHGIYDISMFLSVPGLELAAPRSCDMLELIFDSVIRNLKSPVGIRYPRGLEPAEKFPLPDKETLKKGQLVRQGTDVMIVSCGSVTAAAVKASEILRNSSVSAGVFDPVWLKPAPVEEIRKISSEKLLVTVEEGALNGGFGSMLRSCFPEKDILTIGIPDKFVTHGSTGELLSELGLTGEGIASTVLKHLRSSDEKD